MTKIEFFKHDLSNKNISSLKNIIKSNIITSGNYGIEVEKKLCVELLDTSEKSRRKI